MMLFFCRWRTNQKNSMTVSCVMFKGTQQKKVFYNRNRVKIYWLVVWNMFIFPNSSIVGMMIQSDFHIFQRGRYTTNQLFFCLWDVGPQLDSFVSSLSSGEWRERFGATKSFPTTYWISNFINSNRGWSMALGLGNGLPHFLIHFC